jgi:hypothetical protein
MIARLYADAFGRLSDPIDDDDLSPALHDLAALAYWQGVADADEPDCDLDPFT